MNIISEIKMKAKTGTVIPKPEAKSDFVVKGWGKRRGESALIYKIPNHKNPSKLSEKGVNVGEWHKVYSRIKSGEDFTRDWFNHNMPDCAREGSCNFTTIGGVFQLLGLVDYYERGVYRTR